MSVQIQLEHQGLDTLVAMLNRLGSGDRRGLMQALAAEGESQTRRRIQTEKRAPDGTPWPAWSAGYAETRHGGQSLLQGSGGLLDSITHQADADSAVWGSNMVFAAIHQLGGLPEMAPGPAAVPARDYIGLSAENTADLLAIAERWVDDQLEGRR